MTEQVVAKLLIAAAGVAVFLTGVRVNSDLMRWIGIGLVTVAFLMRFLGRRRGPDGPPGAQ